MPIANCFVDESIDDLPEPTDLIRAWSEHSRIGADDMTINIIRAARGGAESGAMMWLYLPDMWSDAEIVSLQEGLAAAWNEALQNSGGAAHVITSIVPSGHVVANGTTLHW